MKFVSITLAALVFLGAAPSAISQEATPSPNVATISVTGRATVHVRPDTATLTTGVQTIAATARQALSDNNTAMDSVIDTFKQAGVPPEDIATSGFSIHPRYEHDPEKGTSQVTGYQVSNGVTVTIRDLDILGDVLDAAVTNGANQVNGLNFSVSDTERATDPARKAAFADARRRAELYAEAAAADLGRVLSVVEGGSVTPPPMPFARAQVAMATESSVPVQAGSSALEVSVSVVFELLDGQGSIE